jgi:hypothetical protein
MSTEKIASPKPMSSRDVAWTEWSDVPRFALRYRHLTLAAVGEDYHVGVAIEESMCTSSRARSPCASAPIGTI